MAGMTVDRRQRWAAFSVRAHRDIGSLASDVLLYDRIILPVPEDDPERERWVRHDWAPDLIALRTVQAAGVIIPVPWTAQLRAEWKASWDQLQQLGQEVAYGLTGKIYASSLVAWNEIRAGLQPDELPERKPFILAGYQSEDEAKAELSIVPADRIPADVAAAHPQAEAPGGRPVDHAVALQVSRIVEEPAVLDPEEAFLTAISLATSPAFQRARRRLFDLEDDLYLDDWQPAEVEDKLAGLEEEYRDVVRAACQQTRRRRVATLLPTAAGWATVAAGHPHAKGLVSTSLSLVIGRFVRLGNPIDPAQHPGAALAMIRAAYRQREPLP
jgi:hypothetical protein